MRSLSVLKRCVTKEDRCLAHNGWTQARRAKVRSYVCWSACLGKLSELAWDKTWKVSLIVSVALLAPAFMTLCRQSRGQRPLGKTVLNRPFPAVKWSQGLTFVEFIPKTRHSSEIWFQNIIFLSGTFLQVNSQEPCLLGSSALAIPSILWRLEFKVIFLSRWGISATSPVILKEKNKTNKTKPRN